MYDLSVCIPARNEEWLSRTVEDILKHKRGKTEVIVCLDGEWANPPLPDHPDLTIIYYGQSIGQRAGTNQCVKLSKAKYIMKIDAHCSVSEGFDVELIKAGEELGRGVVQIPVMYNFHVFDRVCTSCGNRVYQGPLADPCDKCGGQYRKEVVWQPRWNKKSEFYRFDTTLHFQYHGDRKKQVDSQAVYVETMSAQGSCFFLSKEDYYQLDLDDEKYGSWGQQGTQVGCSTWLSGGRLVTNRKCWYAHMFRTQGKDFGFPYPLSGSQVDKARAYCQYLFMENEWPKQKYSLAWLIKKFKPVPVWHDPEGKEVLDYVNKKGVEFVAKRK